MSDQRGFTILELMIVVAVIAILATVVVPNWTREAHVGKVRSEVNAMFAELSSKEEQFFMDNPTGYYAMAECPGAPNANGQDVTVPCLTPTLWGNIRVVPPQSKMVCAYEVDTGPATAPPPTSIPTYDGANTFSFPANVPQISWYYITAICDADGDGTVFSEYFTSNLDQTIQKYNEGN